MRISPLYGISRTYLFPLALTVLLLAGFGARARAQPVFYIGGGMSYSAGPGAYEYYWNPVFNISGGFGYTIARFMTPMIYIGYTGFSLSEESYKRELDICRYDYANCDVDGGRLSFLTTAAAMKFFVPRGKTRFSPYAKPGFGYIRGVKEEISARYLGDITDNFPDLPTIDVWERDEVNAMFLTLGLGFDYFMTPKSCLYIETEITVGIKEVRGTGFIPVRIGMSFSL